MVSFDDKIQNRGINWIKKIQEIEKNKSDLEIKFREILHDNLIQWTIPDLLDYYLTHSSSKKKDLWINGGLAFLIFSILIEKKEKEDYCDILKHIYLNINFKNFGNYILV